MWLLWRWAEGGVPEHWKCVFASDPPQKTDSCHAADLQTTWHRWDGGVAVRGREGDRVLKSSSCNGAFIRLLLVSDLSVQSGLMDACALCICALSCYKSFYTGTDWFNSRPDSTELSSAQLAPVQLRGASEAPDVFASWHFVRLYKKTHKKATKNRKNFRLEKEVWEQSSHRWAVTMMERLCNYSCTKGTTKTSHVLHTGHKHDHDLIMA